MIVDEDYTRGKIENENDRLRYAKALIQGVHAILRKECRFRQTEEWIAGFTGLPPERVARLRRGKNSQPTELEAWKLQAAYASLAGWANKAHSRSSGEELFYEIDGMMDALRERIPGYKPRRDESRALYDLLMLNVAPQYSIAVEITVEQIEPPRQYSRKALEQVWDELVPAQGPASTLQGELVRALMRLEHEEYSNGNGNLEEELVNFLQSEKDPRKSGALSSFIHLLSKHLPEHRDVVHQLWTAPYRRDGKGPGVHDVFEYLEQALLAWLEAHPDPIPNTSA